jgi:hypothetical protein
MTLPASAAFDLHALRAALDAQREARGLTWTDVAREISDPFGRTPATPVNSSTIRGIGTRSVAEGDGVLQMLLWLDRTPESFVPGHPWANAEEARLPRVGAGRILRFDAAAMHAALDARRIEQGTTWTRIAGEIGGIAASGLTRLAKGGRVGFPDVMRICAWLGRPAASFTRSSSW